ncbi:MAG: glycosyltransferase family 2 protein [Luteimonas sp.]
MISRTPLPTLSVVSPVYGCAGCLEELVERLKRTLLELGERFEILLVDDGSPDLAWTRITELATMHAEVRGLRLSRNFGQHQAIFAGLEHAAGEHIVVMDCDLQDRPEEIPALLRAARAGADIAYGQRVDRRDGIFKRLASRCFYHALSYLTGVAYDHRVANFGVYSRKVVDILLRMPEAERCFPLMVRWTGMNAVSVPVEHAERTHGKSAYDLRKSMRLAIGMVLSYSDKPLRLVTKLGMLLSLLAFGVVGYSVYLYASGKTAVAGYTSIIASIWLLGGVIMFCVGVVGLYVGQMFKDSKRRPSYLVDRRVNFTAPSADD